MSPIPLLRPPDDSADASWPAHIGAPKLVPPKTCQPPALLEYAPKPVFASPRAETSGTARPVPPALIEAWYAGRAKTALVPPPDPPPAYVVPEVVVGAGPQPVSLNDPLPSRVSDVPPTATTLGSEAGKSTVS